MMYWKEIWTDMTCIIMVLSYFTSQYCQLCDAVSLLPHGSTEGDLQTPNADGGFSKIDVSPSFMFYGASYDKIYINNDGIISFNTDLIITGVQEEFPLGENKTMICIFCADIDITKGGKVWYNLRSDSSTINNIANDIIKYEEFNSDFKPSWVFVGTWESVKSWANDASEGTGNTFQVILATDSIKSVVIFQYQDISWVYDAINAYPEDPIVIRAKSGFNAGDGFKSYLHPDSSTDQLINITSDSNVNLSGQFIYRVDSSIVEVTLPATTTYPTTIQPSTIDPTTIQPSTIDPTTIQPGITDPTTKQSSTTDPTTKPITADPTRASPTSAESSSTHSSAPTDPTSVASPSSSVFATLPTTNQPAESTQLLTVHYVLLGVAGGMLLILAAIFVYCYIKHKAKPKVGSPKVIIVAKEAPQSHFMSNGDVLTSSFKIPRPMISNKVHSV